MNGKLRSMIAIYISRGTQMLMLYRVGSKIVAPSWCGIGGHFEMEEYNDARQCILRELKEEIGIVEGDLENIKLRYLTLRLKNSEIRQNYYFFADLKDGINVELKCDEGIPKWVDYNKVNDRDMPFSAQFVLKHYMETGRFTEFLYGRSVVKERVFFTELREF